MGQEDQNGEQKEPQRENRRSPRFDCAGIAAVQVAPIEAPRPGRIVDLCEEGCRIVLDKPARLVLNAVVELIFNVNHLPFRVRGHVRVIRSPNMFGFQFFQVSTRTFLQIEELIDELKEKAAKNGGKPKPAG